MVSIFENTHLYTAFADNSTFFLKNLNSINKLLNKIQIYSSFTALNPSLNKCEIPGISALKRVIMTVFVVKCIDLTK